MPISDHVYCVLTFYLFSVLSFFSSRFSPIPHNLSFSLSTTITSVQSHAFKESPQPEHPLDGGNIPLIPLYYLITSKYCPLGHYPLL